MLQYNSKYILRYNEIYSINKIVNSSMNTKFTENAYKAESKYIKNYEINIVS